MIMKSEPTAKPIREHFFRLEVYARSRVIALVLFTSLFISLAEMVCCASFTNFCIAVVSIQLVFGVFRWLYENIIGPRLIGNSTVFKSYGRWACKWNENLRNSLSAILISRFIAQVQ